MLLSASIGAGLNGFSATEVIRGCELRQLTLSGLTTSSAKCNTVMGAQLDVWVRTRAKAPVVRELENLGSGTRGGVVLYGNLIKIDMSSYAVVHRKLLESIMG